MVEEPIELDICLGNTWLLDDWLGVRLGAAGNGKETENQQLRKWTPAEAPAEISHRTLPSSKSRSRTLPSQANIALAPCDAEILCICSPTPFHHGAAKAAIERGRHVFLEKAMAGTLAEAVNVEESSRRAGTPLGISLKMRFETLFCWTGSCCWNQSIWT